MKQLRCLSVVAQSGRAPREEEFGGALLGFTPKGTAGCLRETVLRAAVTHHTCFNQGAGTLPGRAALPCDPQT